MEFTATNQYRRALERQSLKPLGPSIEYEFKRPGRTASLPPQSAISQPLAGPSRASALSPLPSPRLSLGEMPDPRGPVPTTATMSPLPPSIFSDFADSSSQKIENGDIDTAIRLTRAKSRRVFGLHMGWDLLDVIPSLSFYPITYAFTEAAGKTEESTQERAAKAPFRFVAGLGKYVGQYAKAMFTDSPWPRAIDWRTIVENSPFEEVNTWARETAFEDPWSGKTFMTKGNVTGLFLDLALDAANVIGLLNVPSKLLGAIRSTSSPLAARMMQTPWFLARREHFYNWLASEKGRAWSERFARRGILIDPRVRPVFKESRYGKEAKMALGESQAYQQRLMESAEEIHRSLVTGAEKATEAVMSTPNTMRRLRTAFIGSAGKEMSRGQVQRNLQQSLGAMFSKEIYDNYQYAMVAGREALEDESTRLIHAVTKLHEHLDLPQRKLQDLINKNVAVNAEYLTRRTRQAAQKAAMQHFGSTVKWITRNFGGPEVGKAYKEAFETVSKVHDDIFEFLGANLVEAGLSKREWIERWANLYAFRAYNIWEKPEKWLQRMRQVDPELAEAWTMRYLAYGREVPKWRFRTGVLTEGAPLRILGGPQVPRKYVPKDAAEALKLQDLGEIHDILESHIRGGAASIFAAAQAKRSRAIANALRKQFGESMDVEKFLTQHKIEAVPFPGGYKRWGDLANFGSIPKDLMLALTFGTEVRPGRLLPHWWMNWISGWKFMRVPMNTATQFRNAVTNKILVYSEAGIKGLNPHNWERAAKALRTGSKDMYMQMLATSKHPLLANTYALGDIGWFAKEIDDFAYAKPDMYKRLGGRRAFNWLKNKATQAYNFMERLDKMALFIHYVRKYSRAMPSEKAVWEAAQAAEKALFNYRQVPYVVNWLRRTGVMPFVTFPYKAYPFMVEKALQHPQRMTFMYHLLDEWYDAYPNTKKEQAAAPEWVREGFYFRVPIPDKTTGRSHWLNLTYFLPWADVVEQGTLFQHPHYGEGEKRLSQLPLNIPWLRTVAEFATNTDLFTGRSIWPETVQTSSEILPYAAVHIFNNYGPPVLGAARGFQSIFRDIRAARPELGEKLFEHPVSPLPPFIGVREATRPYPGLPAQPKAPLLPALGWLFGTRVTTTDTVHSMQARLREVKRQISDVTRAENQEREAYITGHRDERHLVKRLTDLADKREDIVRDFAQELSDFYE